MLAGKNGKNGKNVFEYIEINVEVNTRINNDEKNSILCPSLECPLILIRDFNNPIVHVNQSEKLRWDQLACKEQ